jgi:hypothetical protein
MNRGQASDRIIKAAIPMGQKLTLLVYLMHQSSKDSPETGVSWPALPTLALHLQMSRSFVIEARKALTDAKILIADAPGRGEATRYRIDFDRIPALSEEESGAYKSKIREHRSPRGVQRVHPRGPDSTPPGVQDVDPQGSSTDTPRGPDSTPRGSSAYTRTVSMEPSAVDPSPENRPQGNRLQGTEPPAEPSGIPSGLWMDAAEEAAVDYRPPVEEMDPDGWRDDPPSSGTGGFQPSSDDYVFDDAHHDGITEQPSNPRQIESPATRAPEAPPQGPRPSPTRQGNGEGATGPAAPPPPLQPLPPPPPQPRPAQAPLWAAGERPGPGEGQGSPLGPEASGGPVQGAPPAKPARPRRPSRAESPEALAVYGAWRAHHPRAPEVPTADTMKALGRILDEAGGQEGALLLMEWVHIGTCERARQLRGEAAWPDGEKTKRWDLESLSRQVAGRLEMARDWKDRSVDRVTGLKVIHHAEPAKPFRGNGRDLASLTSVLSQIAYDDLTQRSASNGF